MSNDPSPPAGYYPDPTRRAAYRRWDGTGWTSDLGDPAPGGQPDAPPGRPPTDGPATASWHRPVVIAALGAAALVIGTFLPFIETIADRVGVDTDDGFRDEFPWIFWSTRGVGALAAVSAFLMHRRIEREGPAAWTARKGWSAMVAGGIGLLGAGFLFSATAIANEETGGLAAAEPGAGALLAAAGAAAVVVAPFVRPTGRGGDAIAPQPHPEPVATSPVTTDAPPGEAKEVPEDAPRLHVAMLGALGLAAVLGVLALLDVPSISDAADRLEPASADGFGIDNGFGVGDGFGIDDVFGVDNGFGIDDVFEVRGPTTTAESEFDSEWSATTTIASFAALTLVIGAGIAVWRLRRRVAGWMTPADGLTPNRLVLAWLLPLANVVGIPWSLLRLDERRRALAGGGDRATSMSVALAALPLGLLLAMFGLNQQTELSSQFDALDYENITSASSSVLLFGAGSLVVAVTLIIATTSILRSIGEETAAGDA
ncbi:MAG: hypothetical protein AAGF02_14165 [Actinomycetota bacterium]